MGSRNVATRHQFSYLLDSMISKGRKLTLYDGPFIRTDSLAHLAALFYFAYLCPIKPMWDFDFLNIFEIPSKSNKLI